MNFADFSNYAVHYQNQRLSNAHRPYLPEILHALEFARRTVLCTARQCEKSTNLAKVITHHLIINAPTTAVLVLPRKEQIHRMISSRLLPMISQSPLLRKLLVPRTRHSLKHLIFTNGSELISDSAFLSADAVRGVSTPLLLLDEYQDCAPNCLPILEEAQSHQTRARTILSGTAKLSDNELERAFINGTANVWMVTCRNCACQSPANDQIIAIDAYRCPACKAVIDPAHGRWQPQNPHSTFAASFRLPQLITPWTAFADIKEKKRLYQPAQFKNEVLGESVTEGDLSLTISELRACCTARAAVDEIRNVPPELILPRIVGVDWGNTGQATTSVCVGVLDANCIFHVLNWWRLMPGKDPREMLNFVAEICRCMQAAAIGVDSQGNGAVFRPLLMERLQQDIPFFGMAYNQESDFSYKDETANRKLLSMNKTKAIADVVFRVRARQISFPRAEDVETYLLEVASERCVPDELHRTIHYAKSPGQPDDALHSLVYALSVVNYLHHRRPYM